MLCSNCKQEIGITRKEKEVCLLAATGMKNVDIGKRLFIAESTVKNHLSSAYAKLNLSNRLDLTKHFLQTEEIAVEDIRRDGVV